jgi:hypothetical protein
VLTTKAEAEKTVVAPAADAAGAPAAGAPAAGDDKPAAS